VTLTILRQQVDILPFKLTRQGGQSHPVELFSGANFAVISGVLGGTGRNGENGQNGQNGRDGAAEIPDVIDGGNF
jgi:hypothetical protein